MSQKKQHDSVGRAFREALKAAGWSARGRTDKPESISRRTRRQLEKASLENRLSSLFSRIGRLVYERASGKPDAEARADSQLDRLFQEASGLEKQLLQIRKEIEGQGKAEDTLS